MIDETPKQTLTGWRLAKVGELFESWGGLTPSKANKAYWGPGIPWVSSKEIKTARLKTSTFSVTQKAIDETGLRVCPPGSVLVVVRSGILAHTLPVSVTDLPVTINQDLKAFYSDEPYLNEWLALFLRMSASELLASSRRDGTTVQSIQYPLLKNTLIPVPPTDDRRRIIELVESSLAKQSAISPHLLSARRAIELFRQAVLVAAFSGRLTAEWREANPRTPVVAGPALSAQATSNASGAANTNDLVDAPETWAWWSIESITERVIDYRGRTPPSQPNGLIPHVRTTQIRFGHIDWKVDRFITQDVYDKYMTRGIPRLGDVLFTMEAPMGEVGIVDREEPFSIAQRILLLRPGVGLTGEFLSLALQSQPVRRAIEYRATGSGVMGIAYKRLRSVVLPKPPVDEQLEIARRAARLLEISSSLESRIKRAEHAADRTPQALLAKAFRGELTRVT